MKYILTAGWDDGIADLIARLVKELSGSKRVLWLTSGGSNITASVQVMDNIAAGQSRNLTVSLADERYGASGHKDSNWAQLMQAGFNGKNAKLLPVLEEGASFEEAIRNYNELVKQEYARNDIVIAQLGIGSDGHTAGILPKSPAAEEQTALVAGYENPPFKRLTLTFHALRQVTAAYAFAFGEPKQPALEKLQSGSAELRLQPAQILNELPEAYLYSDQVGEHV